MDPTHKNQICVKKEGEKHIYMERQKLKFGGKTSSEKVEERLPYAMIILISLFLGIIGTAWSAFQPRMPAFAMLTNWGTSICALWFGSAPFFLLLIASFASKVKPFQRYINYTSLVYLYAIGAVSYVYLSNHYPWYRYPGYLITVRAVAPEWIVSMIHSWFAPSAEVAKILIVGGVSPLEIPWSEWTPVIFYYTILFYLYALSLLATVNIFRHHWIDIEKLPFPPAMIACEFLRRIPPVVTEPKEKRELSPFVIGVIFGVIFELPLILAMLLPWFPDIYGFRTNTCTSAAHYVPAGSIAAHPIYSVIAGLGSLNKNPAAIAAGYFAPLDILFNAWFWYLIILLLVQVWYFMGYYTANMQIGTCCRAWGAESPTHSPPLNWAVIEAGGIYMIAIMEIIMARRYLVDTIKKALGKKSTLDETNEPGSYRLNWTLLIVSNVILIGLWMMNGLSIPIATLLVVQNLLHAIAQLMFVGLTPTTHVWFEGATFFRFIWPTPPDPITTITREQFYTMTFAQEMTNMQHPPGSAIFGPGLTYRMNSLTGSRVSNRNLFIAMAIAMLIVISTALITMIIVCSAYGGPRTAWFNTCSLEWAAQCGWEHPGVGHWSEWLPHFVAGGLIVVVMRVLRARFIWFPFHPIGFLLAWGYTSLQRGLVTVFFFGWLLKWLTLRIGGSKLYENYGIPFATGFIVGYMAVNLFGGLIGVCKFFFPF